MSKTLKKGVGFALRAINTEQFAVFTDLYQTEEEVIFYQDYDFGADPATKSVAVFAEFRFSHVKTPFLSLKASCHFDVEAGAWNVMLEENEQSIRLDNKFLGHLLMMTIGASRGILHAKTEKTEFNRFLIPPINVTNILRKPVTIEFRGEQL